MALKTKKLTFRSSILVGSFLVLALFLFLYHKAERAKADEFLPSDLNQDGIVDTKDIDLIKQNYANTAGGILNPSPYDLNNDHKINSLDLAIVEDNQGNGTNPDRDWDKDGWSVADGDCADRDKAINPIAEEKADGIDNNCNGVVDEFVNYQFKTASESHEIIVRFTTNDATQTVSIVGVRSRSFDAPMTNRKLIGNYAIVARDSNTKLVDMVGFSPCNNIKTEQSNRDYCDVSVKIPKNPQIATLSLVTLGATDMSTSKSESVLRDIVISPPPVPNPNPEPNPQPIAKPCVGNWTNYADYGCEDRVGDDSFSQRVLAAFDSVNSKMPILTHYPLSSVYIVDGSKDDEFGCNLSNSVVYACIAGESVVLYYENTAQLDTLQLSAIIAHELGHHVEITINYASSLIFGTKDDWEQLMQTQVGEFVRYLNSYNCDSNSQKCSMNPRDFKGAWNEYVLKLNLGQLDISKPGYIWLDPINPATGLNDPMGPRPQGGIGATRSYSQANEAERFATYVESLFIDKLGVDRVFFSTPEVDYLNYKSGSRGILQSDPRYPDITGLTGALSIWGKYGLIKDWDYDGVPDEYDNCAPQHFPGKCATPADPNDVNECSNSDQGDYNKNEVGDKCEFPGELMWTACLPSGGYCPSPDGERLASNSPNTPRWPLTGHAVLDYCSTAEPVYTGGLTQGESACPSPDQK